MTDMKELYEKVAKDEALLAKFDKTIKNAENDSAEGLMKKLQSFAKEAGYEVTPDEITAFFKNLAEDQKGQLSDEELDAVAGGKGKPKLPGIIGDTWTSLNTPVDKVDHCF